ncbi:MAG: branched-chain amino acid aminotransferase [Gammaproteobacteria bacterium]
MTAFKIEPVAENLNPQLPADLGFGRYFTNRMFIQRYEAERGWLEPTIGPYRNLELNPAAEAFQCGQMVFDGTKAYRRSDGDLNLFRVDKNAERFNRSAERMGMPTVDAQFHIEVISALVGLEHRWVPADAEGSLYIRPVMIASEPALEVRASREYLHYIIVSPVGAYFPDGFNPISVYVSDDHVRAVRGGTGEAKTPGNYAASIAVTEEARRADCQQVLWLDAVERKYVDEVGAMNIAFVYGENTIKTPPLSGAILHGVTRDSVLVLAPDLGFEVSEEKLEIKQVMDDIKTGKITEVFGMGTAAVIAPVGRMVFGDEQALINENLSGPVAKSLYRALTDIQYGRAPDPHNWTTKISVQDIAKSLGTG